MSEAGDFRVGILGSASYSICDSDTHFPLILFQFCLENCGVVVKRGLLHLERGNCRSKSHSNSLAQKEFYEVKTLNTGSGEGESGIYHSRRRRH